ncbi:MAG: hypothetical protein J6C98_05795 [Oscillospiraceae bacterium]|nr:hypothetical protein [Oscillospiraceae bacterium]
MARVICYLDGTREVLFHEDDPGAVYVQLEQILQERLGDEVVQLLHQVTEVVEDPEDELRSYEASLESYRHCLQDAHAELCEVLNLLEAPHLNRSRITARIECLTKSINNEL